jgi:chemotaxis protein MotB
MNRTYFSILVLAVLTLTSCVSKKKFNDLQSQLDNCNEQLAKCGDNLNSYMKQLETANAEKNKLSSDLSAANAKLGMVDDLRAQLDDCRKQRDMQLDRVGDLTAISKDANENMKLTLSQLAQKDQYIRLLQAAKTKADSLNLALAVNLKQELASGLDDQDIEVKIDKTVVMINLSDKMLFRTGSANLTDRASEVLGKIATIVDGRKDLEVMVEGYTDNVPISTDCIKDNWDLSVKRSTAVVRVLQNKYKIDPNRLIAAGRGEYNTLAPNDTAENRAKNRRTRIIIMPQLDQFYDLLDPNKVAEMK